jgi:hypothetical protein
MGAGGNNTFDHYMVFNVNQPCTLVSVLVYTTTAGNRTINLEDATGAVLQSATVNIPTGNNRITLNFNLTVGNNFRLECGATASPNLYRNSAGANYPYSDPAGMVTITGSDVTTDPGRYYFFYDWELTTIPCTSAMVPVVVNVNGGTNPSFTNSQMGNTVTFTNTSASGTSWLWNFGDGTTSTAQSPVHTYSANGIYTVSLYSYSGLCSDSVQQTVYIITTGVNQTATANEEIGIYPNPGSGVFTIESPTAAIKSIKIYNLLGAIIYQSDLTAAGRNGKTVIDLSSFSKGIYFAQVQTGSQQVTKRVVIE